MEFLRLLEGIRSPFLDTAVGLITRLGEETVGIVILCALFWCISKKIAYSIGIVYFLSSLTVQGMKVCFRIDRPWIIDPTLNPVPSALEHATGYSFPSGHTQGAAALYGTLGAKMKNKGLMWACFSAAILVAFSRLYLGVHTPLDVVVSLAICAVLILLTLKIYDGEAGSKRDLIISLAIALYAVVIIVIAVVLRSQGKIEENYVSDCLKAAGAGIGVATGIFVERKYVNFSTKTKNIALQIVKFILGFAGVLLLKEGMKLVVGTGLVIDTVRYFLVIVWITAIYPLIIKRFFEAKAVAPPED